MVDYVEVSSLEAEIGSSSGPGGPQRLWSNFPASWPCMNLAYIQLYNIILDVHSSKILTRQQAVTRWLVQLENLVDYTKDSPGEFAQASHRCLRKIILVLWFDHNYIAVELTSACTPYRD